MLFAEREVRVWLRLWRGSVFSAFLIPVMYLGAMGLGLGDLVDRNSGPVEGLDYLSFVAPGLLVASTAQNATGAALWPLMAGFKWLGIYHAAVATPLRPRDVLTGWLTWVGTFFMLSAVPFLTVAALLGGVPSWWGVLAVPTAGLTALAFASPVAAFVASQKDENAFPIIIRIIVLPLFLFSGTFFPVDNLPTAVRPIAWFTPLWHGAELSRGATTGTLGLLEGLFHLAVLVGFVAVGVVVGNRTYAQRLTP
jgi:lipooligosaccharide transport system permease protein